MNPYDVLGVPRDADRLEIKRAYRRKAQQHHPDKEGGDADKFKTVQQAHDILVDPERRKLYDETGDTGESASGMNEQNVALAELATIFLTILEAGKDVDIHAEVVKTIEMGISNQQQGILSLKGKASTLKRAKTRFRHKRKGADNLVSQMIESQIGQIMASVSHCERQIKLGEAMLRIWEDYEYNWERSVTTGVGPGYDDAMINAFFPRR